ncbi:hypothetical protein DL771_009063 [Monosporascus sp. 5C6A]|nr:hypothetical protein DL771_009063 [Monosporascus sp. 5C6A]
MSGKNQPPSSLSPLPIASPAAASESSRRNSAASASTGSPLVDKDQLAQALAKIHTSANQQDILTTFNDLEPPPDATVVSENKGLAGDLVQHGLSGLSKYFRFKGDSGGGNSSANKDKEKAPSKTGQEPAEPVGQDASSAGRRRGGSTSTVGASSRNSLPPVPHTDTTNTMTTSGSNMTDFTKQTSMAGSSSEAQSHQSPSTKTSSTNLTTTSNSKSSSSRQSVPGLSAKPTAPVPTATITPVTVNAFKDTSRLSLTSIEDGSSRGNSNRNLDKQRDGSTSATGPEISTSYGVSEAMSISSLENVSAPSRSRRDNAPNVGGNTDTSVNPHKGSMDCGASVTQSASEANASSQSTRLSARDATRRPAVIDRLHRSRSRASDAYSRSSSMSQGAAEASPISTSAHNSVNHESFGQLPKSERMRSGDFRIPGTTTHTGGAEMHSVVSIIVAPVAASSIADRQDANFSDDSADDSYLPAIFRTNISKPTSSRAPRIDRDDASISERTENFGDASRRLSTPMMAIPATRRVGDSSNRNSAVLEIDAPQLSRPSSSRSLRSISSGRPQSASHRRHHSKNSLLTRFKATPEDRAPFRRSANEEMAKKSGLPAFHDDNVIDPDLAPFMSDESSGDEQQMSLFATISGEEPRQTSLDHDKPNLGPYLGVGRRNRTGTRGEKSISGLSFTSRALDDGSGAMLHPRSSTRRRNMSTASAHLRSPRPKSGLFKGPSGSQETLPVFDSLTTTVGPRLTRSSSMRGDKKPRLELNPASLLHVRKLLRQLLEDAKVPNVKSWEKALVPILLKCTTSVDPDIDRGDDMDIRHYVKLKKIPGGRPSDTTYVSGVIFTKKLALKSMPRRISNPRVVIVSFPIEYQRHQQHFMSLQPVIEQEKEFLRRMVSRISAVRPDLLLAEKGVSGLALQLFSEANIAVAYNVKPSVLSAVSRCLETEIISSLDMLALPRPDFQTGKGTGFEVKTFVSDDLPGRKKTYIFLTGNNEELGCTIALRGASTAVLTELKRITEFMVYVVYNLKLESCLMRDSSIQLPTTESLPTTQPTDDSSPSVKAGTASSDDARQRALSSMTINSTAPSQASNASEATSEVTAADAISPDQPPSQPNTLLQRMVSLHDTHAHTEQGSPVPEDVPMPTYYSDMVAKYETRILSVSPFVKFAQPYLLMQAREQERRLSYLRRLRDQDMVEERIDGEKPKPQRFQLITPQMVHQPGHKAPRQVMEIIHAVHDAEYDKALYHYQTQTRQWENYIQGNLDLFEPYAHQNIVVLHSQICTETKIPCMEPTMFAFAFYDEHGDSSTGMIPDCTLGQYIEDICLNAESTCDANGCDRKMSEHHRTYVHGEARITVFIENDTRDTLLRDNIMMWSYCKSCKRETSELEMSKGTWKYSFGKYLELSFWSRGTRLVREEDEDGWVCPHDHHREHIRYFGFQDKVVRVHYDPIDLLEIIVPRTRITWKVEHDLNMKNDIFTQIQDRWNRFTASVRARLKTIKLENILPDKLEGCKAEMDRLNKRIQEEHLFFIRRLQDAYMNSKYYEVIPLNVVLREMLEKVTEWDATFAQFEADFLPSDKDIRKLTVLHLRKMFTDESKESLSSNEAVIETPEGGEKAVPADNAEDNQNSTSQPSDVGIDISQPSDSSKTPSEAPPQAASLFSATDETLGRMDPLDLATPKSPTLRVPSVSHVQAPMITPQTPTAPESAQESIASPRDSEAPDQTSTSSSVTDQVEELKRCQQLVVLEEAKLANTPRSNEQNPPIIESPKNAPERGSSRRAGLAVSPPIVRAISQPVNSLPTLPRLHSATGKRFLGISKDRLTPTENVSGVDLRKTPTNESLKGDKKLFGLRSGRKGNLSAIPRFVGKRDASRVSTIRKHFEQLSREFEKERERDRKKRASQMSQSRPFLQHSTTEAIVEVYEDADEAVQEPGPAEDYQSMEKAPDEPKVGVTAATTAPEPPARISRETSQSSHAPTGNVSHGDETAAEAETDDQTHHTTSHGPTDDEQGESDAEQSILEGTTLEEIAESLDSTAEIPLELPRHDKMNFMKVLTNFWNERSASEWPPLDYPFNVTDHIFVDSDIIVREDEPSSLIAFALSSEDYREKLRRFHRRRRGEDGEPMSDLDDDGMRSDPTEPISEDHLETSLIHTTSSHYKYQFTEGSAKMLVKIFYAEQFDALRRKCGVADRIVESLSRCLKWDSKGGKTKSVFLKTQDDRMVMKSLSPVETTAFLKFAPAYFSIMAEALFHDLPSVIAKMLGFFQIIIKNPMTNTEIKLDLLLMENLFYDRSPTRIFDLKGSMRNRKIQSTGEQNEVLLDENMVEYIYESPLFAREHSKKLLRASVWNDTLFLARQNVMDYSLMIAVDEARKELVVGIIDCIRTYTWDKKLESWIKDRGFAGGGRNRPTVTSPKEYKSRFREAMARYILQAPNCWHQFGTPLATSRPRQEANAAGDEASKWMQPEVRMSIELNWETLTGGPDGAALAESIRDFIHTKFQSVPLPRFIKSVRVHEFDFGDVAPDVVLKDICDPLPDFYEKNEDDSSSSDDDDDTGGDGEGDAAAAHTRGRGNSNPQEVIPDSIRAAERRRRAEQSRRLGLGMSGNGRGGRGSTPFTAAAGGGTEFPFPPHIHAAGLRSGLATPDLGAPFLGRGASTPGIPGGTSNMHYLQAKLTPGWSGTQTPLAAVAGAQHLNLNGWLDNMASQQQSLPRGRAAAAAAAAAAGGGAPGGHQRARHHNRDSSQGSVSVADISASSLSAPQLDPLLREKHSVSSLAPTPTSATRPPTRDGPGGSVTTPPTTTDGSFERAAAESSREEGEQDRSEGDRKEDEEGGEEEDEEKPRRFREPRPEDLQAVFRIKYSGDVRLLLTAEILLDYPMPSFVGIPVKLNITGLTFDGVGVVAYIRGRVHFCFLSPEDALAAVGDSDDNNGDEEQHHRRGDGVGAKGKGKGESSNKRRVGGLLQEIRVESEIGQREGSKQSLKNVGKVERFVLEQVRRIFEEEFVYPSFWTFLV